MRLLAFAALLLLYVEASSQNKSGIVNTWVPIDVQDYNEESNSWDSFYMLSILTFENDSSGNTLYGGTDFKTPFSYRLIKDSLEFRLLGEKAERVLVVENSEDRLKLFLDSFNTVTYVPLEKTNSSIDIEKLRKALIGKTWDFKIRPWRKSVEIPVDLREGIQDSSLILNQFIKYANDAYLPSSLELDDYPHIWSISENHSHMVLRVETIGIDTRSAISSSLLFIESYNRTMFKGYLWQEGRKIQFTTRLRRNSEEIKARNLSNLTAIKWRLDKVKPEKIRRIRKRGLIDLGTIGDDFIEYIPRDYVHDSSRVVLQSDISQKKLVLEFKQDHSYNILRDNELINSGNWLGLFNLRSIKLHSNIGENEDGILTGHIEVLSLSNKKLVIKRRLFQRLNNQFKYPKSQIETYRPIR
ncbi:hypothetical protein [Roseivirga sp. E12]|uniref:hypothetical protein n=1 Tax=Roseivirga sp. E12 TaxID=2819237 RepID=UPI001ABC9F14|nr:hypothetical protein [Roseivirga sp. E12]MBO3700764.1 hypothetical protein [Roseivirga sp. E12]